MFRYFKESKLLLNKRLKNNDNEYIFLITRNSHYSFNKIFGCLLSNKLHCKVLFNHTAIYNLKDDEQQYDINKLIGFNTGLDGHHKNSARFGWRWNLKLEKLEIFAYVYIQGKRVVKKITDIELNKYHDLYIIDNDDYFEFFVNKKTVKISKEKCKMNLRYLLKPYFGGDLKSTRDIYINIKFY